MKESLFTRTYRYRQRENKNELENLCTEIFAYSFENDLIFRADFLQLLGMELGEEANVSTQQYYENIGRPDIEIIDNKNHIIIECKVDAEERENQLNDYLKIFQTKKNRKKHLVYLTKFYEHKTVQGQGINYTNITWVDVNSLAQKSDNPILTEFSSFLNEKNISMEKNFKSIDLLSLENISNTISKMDEVLDSVKEYFTKSFGMPSKDSSRSTQLKRNAYYNYKNIGNPHKYNIDIGFQWWFDENITYLTIRIYIPLGLPTTGELTKFFKTELLPLEWEFEEVENGNVIGKYLNVNEITATSEEQIPQMIQFLTGRIKELVELKKKNPKHFK
ncbi:MAG: hypothetical protein CMC96_08655 [Flavobacteriales bacterium]|nr:hypothetical protein [Flavobacteriales bacterium]|tara:strand:+ start:5452 stop:6450 length:999 start_codon:yes stop_codon:yes gene_type:complete